MNNNSKFDFQLDKPSQTVIITMQFDADQSLVWDAFSKQEILDQWWAPKPYVSKTKYMNFVVGGKRFYAMISPEGQEGWSLQTYTSITPITNIKMYNAFADENENPQLPGSEWDLNFSEVSGLTTVSITIYNESLERLEAMIDGFKIGITMTYENLVALLETLSNN